MLRRPPLILWGYILSGLAKLILLTSSVLVTVLAFAAAVKFLADGKLGPVDTIRFMVYAMPPMLQYALPFAAGFGATLAYHRLAADNEVTASQAGGIGHRALLGPGLLCGIVLTAVLVGLSNHVIPSLLRSMQEMATQDATRIMIGSIQRGEAVDLGGGRKLMAADDVWATGPDEANGAYQVLLLKGVLYVELDDNGGVKVEGTADRAWVWFFRTDEESRRPKGKEGDDAAERSTGSVTLVKGKLDHFVPHVSGSGRAEASEGTFEYSFPTPLRDDPKFLSWQELREVRDRPEMMGPVNTLRRSLATLLAERAAVDLLRQSLKSEGKADLNDPAGETVAGQVSLRGVRIEWAPEKQMYRIVPPEPDGAVHIDRTLSNGKIRRHVARRAYVHSTPAADRAGREITLEIKMEEVATTGGSEEPTADRQSPVAGTRHDLTISGLTLVGSPVPDMMGMSCAELLRKADERVAAFEWEKTGSSNVGPPRDALRQRIARLMREVSSKEQERAAMALACLVMVLTGSVMAMRLRDSLPLVVYLWSFGPALASVITIIGGQQMINQHGAIGVPILWSGVGGLGLFAVAEYWKLRRH